MPTRREFLETGLGLSLATLLPGTSFGQGIRAGTFKAGAGRADVVFAADLYPLDGFAGQHDPLATRVLLLESGSARLAIAVIDLTSISEEMITGMKAILADVAGVAADNAIVCASHTFSAPHVFTGNNAPPGTDVARNAAALAAFEAALRTAATQAVTGLQPARLGAGQGSTRVNVNRDVATPHGWWLGADEAGFADPTVGVLRIDGENDRPLAIVMNVAVQSSIMDGSQRARGGKLISADLAGAAARHVEAHYGAGTVALFLVGAAGDQAPYLQANRHVVDADGVVGRADIHEAGFALVDLLGERLGGEVVRVAAGIRVQPVPGLGVRREQVELTSQEFSPRNPATGPVTTFSYAAGAKTAMPVMLMRIGNVALVGVQPELAASIGARIRADSPYPHTLVATMVDGAAKYMPDAPSYDRYTYEARSSPYARGAAEAAATAIASMLKRMDTP
ncbi:hypothetical protein [Pseudoxanthomonas sp.]|uniref:hypothetical protein n=1 Tax=Pseudoxanthomonas sp. TaxID=1871049 RepID=UPI00263A13D0|nr:hypothetical protein [Pseudoxanthomonas sp.]WDS34836.1 MAG: hypothetical protein O8I58_10625 [Pseudoxanthomonas sp.]